jgi:hypothetical protein
MMIGPNLILSDTNGIYIPQMFCVDVDEDWAKLANVSMEDVQICQSGPDHEWYWEAWTNILDNARFTDAAGTTWYLHQDGDLWEVPEGFEWPEE